MAEVNLKNGYIKIANNLFEQLFIRDFSLKQLRILLLILRLSYGFNKDEAVIIPFARFDVANIHKCDIKRILGELQNSNIIICDYENKVFTLNKNFDEWNINFHSTYSDKNFLNLKSKQFDELFVNHKQNECKKVCKSQTQEVCETQTDKFVKHKLKSKKGLQITNPIVCETQTKIEKRFAKHKPRHLKERYCERDTDPRKYIIKDIIKYIYIKGKIKENKYKNLSENNQKKFDLFFHPVVTFFKSEYEKVFKQRCYLNSNQTKKLIEINSDNPDFQENIPELLKRYKKTIFEFKNGTRRASLRWLIEEENWSGVLNGDFEILKNQGEWISDDYYTN